MNIGGFNRDCNNIHVNGDVRSPASFPRVSPVDSVSSQRVAVGTDEGRAHVIRLVRGADMLPHAEADRVTFPHKGMIRAVATSKWMLATGSSNECVSSRGFQHFFPCESHIDGV
jgi:hypothetical protein